MAKISLAIDTDIAYVVVSTEISPKKFSMGFDAGWKTSAPRHEGSALPAPEVYDLPDDQYEQDSAETCQEDADE